ncbi:MAG: hypothetical protein ACTSUR_07235 [Candidatus Heimdallarchaeaceae archaeon]
MNAEESKREEDKIVSLTRDQQLLLYTIDYIAKWMTKGDSTIQTEGNRVWIKELPLWAIIYYQIVSGTYETYDYAPTSIQFFGRSSFTINLSYEGVDDIEDLRELEIIEKIQINFNETSSLLLSMELETSKLELNQQELYEKTIELLETKGILI